MSAIREVREGSMPQGVNEEIPYGVTTTPWGSLPSNVVVVAYDVSNAYTDVSATVLSGAASVTGDVITTPVVKSLTAEHVYRIEVQFTCGGTRFSCYFVLVAER